MPKKNHYIYIITNNLNGKIYVGKRSCICAPENDTKYMGSGIVINRVMEKYGADNFSKEIIEICHSDQELNNAEYALIEITGSRDKKIGYNVSRGGQGGKTTEMTDQLKKKISNALKGRRPSEKTYAALRIHNKNKRMPQSMRDQISKKLKGREITAYHRTRISLTHKGKKVSKESLIKKFHSQQRLSFYGQLLPFGIKKTKWSKNYTLAFQVYLPVNFKRKYFGAFKDLERAIFRRNQVLNCLKNNLTIPPAHHVTL